MGDTGPRRPRSSFGTPLVTAPEVLDGAPSTPAADLYSLGVLIFRLVTGAYPVMADTFHELVQRHRRGERTRLVDLRPDLPLGFTQVVERALRAKPRERFVTAGEMEGALAEWSPWPDPARLRTPAGAYTEGQSHGDLHEARGRSGVKAPRQSSIPAAGRGLSTGAGPSPIQAGRRWSITVLAGLAVVAGVLAFWQPWQRDDARPVVAGEPVGASSPPPPTTVDRRSPPEVEAQFYRTSAYGTEPLRNGDAVQPGDQLHLLVAAPEPFYAYVINEDDAGGMFVLYPVPGLEPANPLPPSIRHRLPGSIAGEFQDWQVTSAGGRETILLICATAPLADLESYLASVPEAAADRHGPDYAALDPDLVSGLRGIGGLAPASAGPGPAGRRLIELGQSLESSGGAVYVRWLELRNDGGKP